MMMALILLRLNLVGCYVAANFMVWVVRVASAFNQVWSLIHLNFIHHSSAFDGLKCKYLHDKCTNFKPTLMCLHCVLDHTCCDFLQRGPWRLPQTTRKLPHCKSLVIQLVELLKFKKLKWLDSRAGQNFQGLNFQTPPRSLAQNINVYQVWGP